MIIQHILVYSKIHDATKIKGHPRDKTIYIVPITGLLVECGKKWKIVRKILPNSAGNSAKKSEIVREF